MAHKQYVIESSYRCEECGISFYNRAELSSHSSTPLNPVMIVVCLWLECE